MTTANSLGYAFTISLPPSDDHRLRQWAEATPGATWDMSGGHVTVARLTGSLPPESIVPIMHDACRDMGAFEVALTVSSRQDYWDKPGLEIVMLVAEGAGDVENVMELRERLLARCLLTGLSLMEGGDYVPHVTLTTGVPSEDARRLESAARDLALRFTAHEIVFWCGGETLDPDTPADPPWHVVERLLLL